METESEGHLPFLDLNIYRRPDGSLGHRVYRKPTHTNLYLSAMSTITPPIKQATLSTLVHRARALCDQESLPAELDFLKDIFRQNDYNNDRAAESSTVVSTPTSPTTIVTLSPSCPISGLYSTESAECCPDTT
jgi:hypothetical protein